MLSLGVFGAIAVHVNSAFLVLTAKLVTRGVLFERYFIAWQTRMLAQDMMYSGSTTETRLDETRVANRVASPIGLFINKRPDAGVVLPILTGANCHIRVANRYTALCLITKEDDPRRPR
jgi:hypothetical protein